MEKQINYYRDYIKKIGSEIAELEQLGDEERSLTEELSRRFAQKRAAGEASIDTAKDALSAGFQQIRETIDRKARRQFCIYAEQAKTNGHSFQAHLLKTQLLPQLQEKLTICERERAASIATIKQLPPVGRSWETQDQAWKWKEQATKCGMQGQYDFIYSYTSRLIHATPVSLTTNQKLLEPDEMVLFLDYIYVSFSDAIELTQGLFGLPGDRTALH